MSFGASNTTKTATNNLGGLSNLAQNVEFPMFSKLGGENMNTGSGNVASGTNLFNTILHGNSANTTAALQPSIDEIRKGSTGTLNSINTLMPRGGGRSGTLFDQSFAPHAAIQNLFSGMRTTAGQALPQIGLAQQGIGTNLFNLGNQALNTGAGINNNIAGIGFQTQARSDAIDAALGKTLFGLATTPFGQGGGTLFGKM